MNKAFVSLYKIASCAEVYVHVCVNVGLTTPHMNPAKGDEVELVLVLKEFLLVVCGAGVWGTRLLRDDEVSDGEGIATLRDKHIWDSIKITFI